MAAKRWGRSSLQQHQRSSNTKCPFPAFLLLSISIALPLLFFTGGYGVFSSHSARKGLVDGPSTTEKHAKSSRELSTLERIELYFPKEVLDVIVTNSREPNSWGHRSLRQKVLFSSLIKEAKANVIHEPSNVFKAKETIVYRDKTVVEDQTKAYSKQPIKAIVDQDTDEHIAYLDDFEAVNAADMEFVDEGGTGGGDLEPKAADQALLARKQVRLHRHEKRLKELLKQNEEEKIQMENAAIKRSKEIDNAIIGKHSVWRRDGNENPDTLARLMKDQLIMARAYSSIAQTKHNGQMLKELKFHIRESQRCVADASADADLCRSAPEKIRAMGQLLTRAREELPDSSLLLVRKLRAMLQSVEEHARILKKQSTFLSQLAAKTIPKGLHCFALRLNVEYHLLPGRGQENASRDKLEGRNLYHYALFSDNILAASVVVNSTVRHAQEPEKHVFHLVTDKLNYAAMKMWFLMNPPGKATVNVDNVDEFKWLNSSYCPVLRQLEHKAMKDYYFKQDQLTSVASVSSNMKYRNPKYLSMLNHLRFYLPQIYPYLDKILFLDDDIVVQKDLTPLWSVDLHGKVNGAVETCGASFHRFDKYLNFSNPHIARNFEPDACGWAYGMNIFDLAEWKRQDITGIYHRWQNLNEDRNLWKLGTLPPGLITFYNLTYPLEKSWHVLGLGYNPSVDRTEIENAAVIHYNGNLKPWLEIGLARYKPYWTKYIKFDDPFLRQCNINE